MRFLQTFQVPLQRRDTVRLTELLSRCCSLTVQHVGDEHFRGHAEVGVLLVRGEVPCEHGQGVEDPGVVYGVEVVKLLL